MCSECAFLKADNQALRARVAELKTALDFDPDDDDDDNARNPFEMQVRAARRFRREAEAAVAAGNSIARLSKATDGGDAVRRGLAAVSRYRRIMS